MNDAFLDLSARIDLDLMLLLEKLDLCDELVKTSD